MRRKEALYAVIGGVVGTVLTLVVCSFSPLGAQSQSDGNFGEITCRRLRLVGGYGVPSLTTVIDSTGVIVGGGSLRTEMTAAGVDIHGSEGSVSVIGSNSIGVGRTDDNDIGVVRLNVYLTTDEHGGRVIVRGKDGGSAVMETNPHGGAVGVFGGDGESSALMLITKYGGMVGARDKNGVTTRLR